MSILYMYTHHYELNTRVVKDKCPSLDYVHRFTTCLVFHVFSIDK